MKFALLTLTLLTFMIQGALASTPDSIGQISLLEGTATKSDHVLSQGDVVFQGDHISTGDHTRLKISFIDNTVIIPGANSTITLDEFAYDPAHTENNKLHFNLSESIFHYISGKASKNNPDARLDLIFGSIGIRGTEIWRDMITDDQNRPTCRIYVENGEIDVTNDLGQVTLTHGQGTMIHGPEQAPAPAKKWKEESIANIKSKSAL